MPFQDELFGKTTYEKRYVNDPLQKQIDLESASTPEWFRTLARGAAEKVAAINPALIRQQSAMTDKLLGGASKSAARLEVDPTQQAKDWTNFQMGNLTKLINQASGADSAAAKLMKARLGYAGRPGGSFDTVLRTREFANQYAPIGASIINNSAGQSALNRGQDASAIATMMSLAGMLPGIYDSTADAYMRPARAASGVAGSSADLLTALGQAARTNFAGYEAKTKAGIMDYVKAANEMIGDLYGIIGSSGGGGGGGGGGGSGGGGGGGGGMGGLSGIMGLLSMAGIVG